MTDNAPALELRDLRLSYGKLRALDGLSLELRRGEILGLLGPNGAGKTSALECLLGLRRPDSGSIRILGEEQVPGSPGMRSLIGAQLQDASLQDKLTPAEALTLFGAFHPRPPDVPALLQRFGLTEKADTHFHHLSEGLKRRLFLALAFLNEPRILILDEPSAGLDPRSREDLHQLIRGLRASGRSVLLSTHYIEEAELLCDRVALLDAGRLVALDTPAALIARSKTVPRVQVHRPTLADVFLELTGKPVDP
jgi:ABC-2 type transport system ATP-binding protein